MHILVTGATGFVGTVLVGRLLGSGHRVTCLGRPDAPGVAGTPRIDHALGSGAPPTLPPGIDAVAHLAQSRIYRSFPGDAATMFAVNVGGAQEVLAAAASAGVTRFCLVSSGTVYEPFDAPLDESVAVQPLSYLGATKLAAEVLARPFSSLFPISVLRLFTPYGPGQISRLVPDLIRRVRGGEAVILPLVGGGMRFSPTFVDDVAAVIETALIEAWSDIVNVAAPETLTIEEAAQIIGGAVGRRPLFERKALATPCVTPRLERLGARYDLARLRRFADGIEATLAAGR